MRIVANVAVANERDLIDGFLAHHRALGVDAFVVTDVCSTDGTRERLEELAGYDLDLVLSPTTDRAQYDWSQVMTERAQDVHAADWVLRIDADERLLVATGDVADLVPSMGWVRGIPRANAVWADPEAALVAARGQLDVTTTPIVVDGHRPEPDQWFSDDAPPWVLSAIVGRVLARADPRMHYLVGGHEVAYGANVARQIAPGGVPAVVAHLPFTTLERFTRKVESVVELAPRLAERFGAASGWHWQRWAAMHARGPAVIAAEFERQFLATEDAEQMLGRPVIRPAATVLGSSAADA